MSNDKQPDATFSDLVTQWERSFNDFANQVMGTEGFSQAMNQAQNAQLGFQKMLADNMRQQLQTMNMPTREDVLRLAEAVHQMDRRLERIEEQLGASAGRSASDEPPRPPRTKQPPSSQEGADSQ